MSKVSMKWSAAEGIYYLDGALLSIGRWGGGDCYLAPAVGEGGTGWALLMVGEGSTEVVALWYSPGEPDYVAEHDGDEDELTKIIHEAADAIEW